VGTDTDVAGEGNGKQGQRDGKQTRATVNVLNFDARKDGLMGNRKGTIFDGKPGNGFVFDGKLTAGTIIDGPGIKWAPTSPKRARKGPEKPAKIAPLPGPGR
jgi:hypothetical protein